MSRLRFHEVDVFASGPLTGNPVAVVHDSSALSTEQMQRLATWTNFSETTFLLPPEHGDADYRLRIFTPAGELPFAGHPTLGSAAAWLAAGGVPRGTAQIVQQCGVGLVPIRRRVSRLAFAAPPLIRSGPLPPGEATEIGRRLRVAPEQIVGGAWVDNGPGWRALRLTSAEAVLAAEAPAGDVGHFHVGLVGPYARDGECAVEVRAFFNDATGAVREDPVTGSLNASLAQWLLGEGVLDAPYVACQGTRLGRAGRVHVDTDRGEQPHGGAGDVRVWVGGQTRVIVDGTITLGA